MLSSSCVFTGEPIELADAIGIAVDLIIEFGEFFIVATFEKALEIFGQRVLMVEQCFIEALPGQCLSNLVVGNQAIK